MIIRFKLQCRALAMAVFASAVAFADTATLPTVVVVGTAPLSGAEIDADKLPAPVQNATAEEIKGSHALDLTAFMNRSLGSVYINDIQNNPLQADLSFRGYTASPLLGTAQGLSVYLDGVRLNQPFGDVVSWDLLPHAAIASMTLMPGSNPIFGLNTLGGALSLRTKDGFSAPDTALQVSYGSHRTRSAEFETGGHAGEVHWYATANQLLSDGWRDASPTDARQFFAKTGWRGERTDFALTTALARTDLNGNGLQEQRLLARDYSSVYTKPDITLNHSALLDSSARHDFTEDIALATNAYYRNIETRTVNGDLNDDALAETVYQPTAAELAALASAGYVGFPLSGESAANTPFPKWRCIANVLLNSEPNEKCNAILNTTRTSQHEVGVTAQLVGKTSIAERNHQWLFGLAGNRSEAHFTQFSQFGYLSPNRNVTTVGGLGATADGTQDSASAEDTRVDLTGTTQVRSVYASDTFGALKNLDVTISGRYDRTSVSNEDALVPAGANGSLSGHHVFSRFNPAAGVAFALNPALTLYGGYSEGSRAPSAIELGCADPLNPCRLPNALAGDPPLRQVTTRTFELGVRVHDERFAWNAGVFSAENRDDILFVANDTAGFGYFKNFGATRRRGLELGARAEISALAISAHYTFLDATYRSAERINADGNSSNDAPAPGFPGAIEVQPGDRIPLLPRHLVKATLQWNLGDSLTFSADALLASGQLARGNENGRHEADGLYYLGPGEIGGYTIANLGLDYRPLEKIEISLQIDNVFDRRYATAAQLGATGFDAAGNFIARPFATPVIDGERPLRYATFYAPGAPRSFLLALRLRL